MSESSSAIRNGLEVLGVLVGLLDGTEWHTGIAYLSSGTRLLMRSCGGAWPWNAAADTQANRQAKHCAHRGILIEQSVLGSLPL